MRVRVPPSQCAEARAEMGVARELFREAQAQEPGELRARLSAKAVRALLLVIARALDESGDPARGFERAVERVEASLAEEGDLRAALAFCAAEDTPRPSPEVSAALPDLFSWTLALIDRRPARERRLHRYIPWVTAAALAAVLVGAVARPKNLARGKPVTVSSQCRAQDTSRAVDGFTFERLEDGGFALCTGHHRHPWVTVDLGKSHKIERVVVYNRNDCCWGVDDTPLTVQLSEDNKKFEEIGRREEPLPGEKAWTVHADGQSARYVRLYNPAKKRKNIVISELEVYGR